MSRIRASVVGSLPAGYDRARDLELVVRQVRVGQQAGRAGLGAHGRALYDEVAVAQFHSVQALDGHVGDAGIEVLEECEALCKMSLCRIIEETIQYLGCTSSVFSDEIERSELAEALEELHDVFFVEVSRQTADKHFVDGIRNIGGDDARYMDTR